MRSLLIAPIILVLSGCSGSGSLGTRDWSNWETSAVMLPAGFPYPVRNELCEENNRFFWVFDYDLTGDMDPDIRVWYYVHSTVYDQATKMLTLDIARNPHKVERLSLGLIPTVSKVDYQLAGKAEEIQRQTKYGVQVKFP
jgi:hypothetical protein